jgi:hypothetical protein
MYKPPKDLIAVVTMKRVAEVLDVPVKNLYNLCARKDAPVWKSGGTYLCHLPTFRVWYAANVRPRGRPKKIS